MKENIDWRNLGFGYRDADYRYVSEYKNGSWDNGRLTKDNTVTMSECAGVLQYAQTCFEGMKAYETADKRILCFRPELNAERMIASAKCLEMPVFPKERYMEAVAKTVRANARYVPPFGTDATLYIRPYMYASSAVLGVKPAEEYTFRVFTTPVSSYFKEGIKPLTITVSDYDRAAPNGTGHVKAGLNYAMSLHAYVEALPSITRRSLLYVAENYLGLKTEEREIYLDELKDFIECGLCGTAAVISPVGKIVNHQEVIEFPSGMSKMGKSQKSYTTH